MKKDKQVSREYLRDVVEVTSRISAWFGFEIVSWSMDSEENAVRHISNYKEISMSRDGFGDYININFEDKTINLGQRYYNCTESSNDFSTMEHLNRRDQAALLSLACEFSFEYSYNEYLQSDYDANDFEEEDEEVDAAPVVVGNDGTLQ